MAASAAIVPAWGAPALKHGVVPLDQWDGVSPIANNMPRPAKVAKRSAYNPVGTVYGVITAQMGEDSRPFWGLFDLAEAIVNPVYTGSVYANSDYELQAGAVRDGILYIPDYHQNMVTNEVEIVWKRVNINTGDVLEPLSFGGDTNAYCYSLTYDSDNDRFVGLGMDIFTGAQGNLVIFDCKQTPMKPQLLGNVGGREGDFMAGIAYNPADGMVYGLKDNGGFYMIDPDWMETTLVKRFDPDNEWFMIPQFPMSTPLVYSPRDKAFVTVCINYDTRRVVLGFLDSETYDAVEGYDLFPTSYVASLWCADKYAVDEAPDAPFLTDINFEGPSLSGTVTLTAPGTTFAGEPATGNIVLNLALNGETVYESTFAPAEQRVVSLDVKEGFYTANLTAWFESDPKAVSPAATQLMYVGHDIPLAPAGLEYKDGVLSWNAVSGEGTHKGYVDAAAITYDVWMDGVHQNAEPVSGTSMQITLPDSPRVVDLTVTANANGKTSEHSAKLSKVLGHGMQLPAAFTPTEEEAALFTTFNADGDEHEFNYVIYEGEGCFRVRTGYYYQKPNDWLFLPPVRIDDTQSLYKLALNYVNTYRQDNGYDDMEIWIGNDATPGAMSRMIYSHTARVTQTPLDIEAPFSVDAAGSYVIGIHACADYNSSSQYRGVDIKNLSVSAIEGSSVKAPADAMVDLKGADKGELSADVTLTAPTTDITGAPLASGTPLSVKLTNGENSVSLSALPGETATGRIALSKNGFNEVVVTPSNSYGEGIPRIYRVFAGLDKPASPRALKSKVADDNMSLVLTWEAPDRGVNGGYVDPSALVYNVFIQGSAGNNTFIGTTSGTTFTYESTETNQSRPSFGITASNALGETSDPVYIADYIGRPHELPMNEEFNNAGFSYPGLWWNDVNDSFGAEWNSVNNLDGLGMGDPVFVDNGGLSCVNLGGAQRGRGKILASKFTTKNVPAAAVEIVYWDYPGAGDMELWVRSASNQEERKLASITPERSGASWKTWSVPLPAEMMEEGWVQANLVCSLSGSQNCVMDAYRVVQNIEYDFKVLDLTAPYNVFVGETANCSVKTVNSGKEPMGATLVLDLLSDGNVVATQSWNIGRTAPGNTYERNFGFEMKTEYSGTKMQVRATIESDDDQIQANNVEVTPFMLTDCVVPTVRDLAASASENGKVNLTWSRPDTSYGDFESFEKIPTFGVTDVINGWLNVDRDGLPEFPIEALRWEGDDKPCAWTVFDAEEKGTMSDERMAPRSGSQMLIARSVMYNEGVDEPVQNSDWLISPEVVGGTVVDFWLNTISSQYSETVAIYYSTTDRNPESFVKGRNFTKTGSESWEHVKWTLPEDAKYFALVYESWGTFAAMIDDITFTPAAKSQWTVNSYDIWHFADDQLSLVAEGVLTEGAEVDSRKDGLYYVTVNADRGEGVFASPLSNGVFVASSGIEGVEAGDGVIGAGRGFIFIGGHAGERIEIYALDGRLVAAVANAADRETIDLPAGLYTVKAGRAAAKVLVK
ncbi:MAG: hypothetical protein K2O24_08780 [Muribaculaceae bacterium]|nr:hypothetical protein [Muribaculaceae bacterium]